MQIPANVAPHLIASPMLIYLIGCPYRRDWTRAVICGKTVRAPDKYLFASVLISC
jgi:hypothetical protein